MAVLGTMLRAYAIYLIFIVCILLCVMTWCFGLQQIYQKLNQSNITVLHWFHLVTTTCFNLYLDHHQAVFLNMYITRY
jgi:hypothetical protein